jgi:hypothetical protein
LREENAKIFSQCDESRPSCTKCRDFGFSCDYRSPAQDCQLSVETVANFTVDIYKSAPEFRTLTLDAINAQLRSRAQSYMKANEVLQLDANDFAVLNTFQTRTLFTICVEETVPMYRNELVRLACQVRTIDPCFVINTKKFTEALLLDAYGTWNGKYAYEDTRTFSVK